MGDYAKDVLVDTQWVENHLGDDSVRIVEVDENPALYAEAHIPGAIGFDWKKDLQDQVKRDFLGPAEFGELLGGRGISNDHTIVLYGDRNNWFAAYTYWYLKYYGHDNVKLMNGPREKWISEDRPTTTRDLSTWLSHDDARRLLERAVDELPEAFRLVFVLRDIEEMTTEETASQLGIRPETVKTRLHRARRPWWCRGSGFALKGAALARNTADRPRIVAPSRSSVTTAT